MRGRVGELEPEKDAVDDSQESEEEEESLPLEARSVVNAVGDDSSLSWASDARRSAVRQKKRHQFASDQGL